MDSTKSKPLPAAFKDLELLDPEECENYKKAFKENGMSGLKAQVDEDMDRWKNTPVNIAVTGNSGVGKSSFINSFRGLKSKSEGAAEVGVDETTVEPTKYMHPTNPNIALWDLPGVGTPRFPKDKYLEEVKFDMYDYFLIITATRFTENDVWLANEVQRLGKKFFFIRSKIANDVRDQNYENSENSEDETVNKVREAMAKIIAKEGFKGVRVFLIDNHSPLRFDFPDLIDTMINEAPKMKQDALTLTMTNLTESLINQKKAALQKRIIRLGIGSAIGAAIPLPGLSLVVDGAIVLKESRFYRKQLGLDDDSLKEYAETLDTTVEHLRAELNLRSHVVGSSATSIAAFVSALAISEAAESISALAIPLLGSLISGSLSYGSTVAVLRSILDAFVTDALAINQRLMQQLSSQNNS